MIPDHCRTLIIHILQKNWIFAFIIHPNMPIFITGTLGMGFIPILPIRCTFYDFPDNYEKCLTTWNVCGTDTVCQTLNISSVFIEENNELFKVYPNPARDVIFINGLFKGSGELVVLDLSGKTVLRENIVFPDVMYTGISLKDLSPGIYFVRVNQGQFSLYNKLIISR